MSKILIFANDFTTIDHFRIELVRKLIIENYTVILSLPNDIRNQKFFDLGCYIDPIKVDRWGKNPINDLVLLFSYLKQIRQIRPDIVLTYTIKPNIYGSLACLMTRKPYINNITGLGSVVHHGNCLKFLILKMQKFAYRKSDYIFFQNKEILDYFHRVKLLTNENYRTIPGSGVNLNINKFNEYPVKIKNMKFITISRIRKDKGFEELFSAIKKLTKKYNFLEFHIAGWYEDKNYESKINDMVKCYPVIYHGNQTQQGVRDLLFQSHCLIHPSHHEGMSNAILEAAACGRPCIVSDIPGCRQAVEDGITGYTFKVKDSSRLIEKIEKFIQLPYVEKKAMGIAGRKKMEREFDRNIVVNAYMEEIERIISQKKGNPS